MYTVKQILLLFSALGKCRVYEKPAECPDERDNFCVDDSGCVEGLKCCDTGCENECVGELRILACIRELFINNNLICAFCYIQVKIMLKGQMNALKFAHECTTY